MGEMMQTREKFSSSVKLISDQTHSMAESTYKIPLYKDDTTDEMNTEQGFKCRWIGCGIWFSRLELLAAHVTQVHAISGAGGLFFCGWEGCSRGDRGFNARYKMLVHVRTHTNEKPHQCFKCAKSFSRAENLKIHARSHTGEKPYVCPVEGCGKAYSNSSDRFKHTRTHSVDKPYVCKVAGCPKRYTDPSSLRKHVKTYRHFPCSSNNVCATVEKAAETRCKTADNVLSLRNVIVDKNTTVNFLAENSQDSLKSKNSWDETDIRLPKNRNIEDMSLDCDVTVQSDDSLTNSSDDSKFHKSESSPCLSSPSSLDKLWDNSNSYPFFSPWFGADLAILSYSLPLGMQYWTQSALHRGNLTRAHENNISPLGLIKNGLLNCSSNSEQILPLDLTVKATCKN